MFDQLLLIVNSWMMARTKLAALGYFLLDSMGAIFSPCHWASLFIVVSYIAGRDKVFRVRYSIHYATAFIGGQLITIALSGAACRLPDRMPGESGHYLTIPVGAVLILMAVDILGVTRYSVSGSLLGRIRIKGLGGAFLLGLAYGAFSGSCTFIHQKIVTEMLFFVFLVLGYCLPIVEARSSTAKEKRLPGSHSFQEEGTWFRKCAGTRLGLLGVYFVIRPFIGVS